MTKLEFHTNKGVRHNRFSIYILYICILIAFLVCNYSFISKSSATICNLVLIIIIQILIFIVFKVDIISGISILTIFTLWPSLLVYYFHTSQNLGDLTLGIIPIYMYDDTFYVFIFIMALFISAYAFRLNYFRDEIMHSKLLHLNILSIYFNNIIAIMASIIAFPGAPRFGQALGENSFHGLLPGSAWNQLAIVALLFNFGYLFKHRSVIFTYLFVIFWFVTHGERADLAGFFLFIIIFLCSSKDVKKKVKILAILFGICVTIFFISIKSNYSIINSLGHLFTFTTVSDTSYELNEGVNYISSFGFTHGQIFFSTLKSMAPFTATSHSVGFFLKEMSSYYPGGSSVINEPLMDWGIYGVVLVPIFYITVLKFISKMKFSFAKYEMFILICLIPRISWYGIDNVFTSVIIFIPFVYLVDKIISSEFSSPSYGSDK